MYQTCIYNYDKLLEEPLLSFIHTMMKKTKYFLSKSWEGGPHIQLVTEEKLTDSKFNQLKNHIVKLKRSHFLDEAYISRVKLQYEQNAQLLSNLENKTFVKRIRDHGEVEICLFEFDFQNAELTQLYLLERFEINQLLIDTKSYLLEKNVTEEELFPLIFAQVSEIYHDKGNNKGYFSFISHVQGFFELSDKQQMPYSEALFEEMYQKKNAGFEMIKITHSQLIKRWGEQFSKFYERCLSQIDQLVSEEYKVTLDNTIVELKNNFQNDFHKNFVSYAKQNNFMEKPEATAYRFTINLLYLTLPLFNISALKKQKYIYMAYREVEKRKGKTWKEELNIGNENQSKSI